LSTAPQARQGHRRLGRRAGATLHGSQAPKPVRAFPERLHDEITAVYNDMIYAISGELAWAQ
jgi:hypothetical protein